MSAPVAAIVPAAGRSTRMGRPKLVLGLGSESVIQRVVRALRQGGAEPVLVVAPVRTKPGAIELADQARREGARVFHCPEPTPDMRATVCVGLAALRETGRPPAGLLLAPGDCPGLRPELVARVMAQFRDDPTRLVVPVYQGKRGHPLALPWALAAAIPELPEGTGVKALLDQYPERLRELPVADRGAVSDLDTPEDYRRWTSTTDTRTPTADGGP
jgi:molybdenum cofactor cytidylyltransferase